MPDDPAFIGLERAFALGLQRCESVDIDHRVRAALGDRVPEPVEDIIVSPPVEPAMRAVPAWPGNGIRPRRRGQAIRDGPSRRRILRMPGKGIPATGNCRYKPYEGS